MTLDEAIVHCEEVACGNKVCEQCAADHMQLAEFLKGYERLLEESIAHHKEVVLNLNHELKMKTSRTDCVPHDKGSWFGLTDITHT